MRKGRGSFFETAWLSDRLRGETWGGLCPDIMVGDQGARTASLTQRTFHFDTCCLFSVRATRPTEKAYASARVNRKQNEVTVLCCVVLCVSLSQHALCDAMCYLTIGATDFPMSTCL